MSSARNRGRGQARALAIAASLAFAGCSGTGETNTVATIGGAPQSTVERSAITAAADESDNSVENETAQTSTEEVAQPDLNNGLETVGYGEPSGVQPVGCTGIEPGWQERRIINTDDYLNIRDRAGGEVIMRIAPGFEVFALVESTSDVDQGKRPQLLDGEPWVLVELPGPGPYEGPAQYGCGWAHGAFVSSPTDATFADEYLSSDDTVDSVGSAVCLTGFDVVFGATNANVSFAFCSDAAGALQYHGVDLSNGNDIRLSACRLFEDFYLADNSGFRYEGSDERSTQNSSSLFITDPDGELILWENFVAVAGTGDDDRVLRSC